MGVLGRAQAKRLQNFRTKGETGLLGMAPFDPLGLRDDYKRQSEVRPVALGPHLTMQSTEQLMQVAWRRMWGVHWRTT